MSDKKAAGGQQGHGKNSATFRRTWDKAYYAQKAREKDEEEVEPGMSIWFCFEICYLLIFFSHPFRGQSPGLSATVDAEAFGCARILNRFRIQSWEGTGYCTRNATIPTGWILLRCMQLRCKGFRKLS